MFSLISNISEQPIHNDGILGIIEGEKIKSLPMISDFSRIERLNERNKVSSTGRYNKRIRILKGKTRIEKELFDGKR